YDGACPPRRQRNDRYGFDHQRGGRRTGDQGRPGRICNHQGIRRDDWPRRLTTDSSEGDAFRRNSGRLFDRDCRRASRDKSRAIVPTWRIAIAAVYFLAAETSAAAAWRSRGTASFGLNNSVLTKAPLIRTESWPASMSGSATPSPSAIRLRRWRISRLFRFDT